MSESATRQLMTIEQAAKYVGKRFGYVKELVIKAGIAINDGGTDKHPRIKVHPAELDRVMLSRRLVNPKRRLKRTAGDDRNINPRVRC